MSSLARIWTIATNTVREAVRNKLLYVLLFFAVLLILTGVLLSALSYVESERILQDIGLAAIRLFGVAIAVFDLEGVRSMRENPTHVNTSPFTSYNYHGKGIFATMVDVVVLGATEVDVHFNANVVTHSDGRLLHGIGGWQNCLFSRCTMLPIPSFRDRIPVLVDRVTTLCGPGELIDVVVTERGIAINPARQDLTKKLRGSSLPIRSIEEIKAEVEEICGGKPAPPQLDEKIVAAIKWVDGTVIDCVRQARTAAFPS